MNHCKFYSSKLRETDNPHRDLAEFISSVNLERIRNFSQSLILFGDGEELLANEMLDSDFVTTARNRYSMEAVVSQNKITDAAFVIECHGFGFFCLKPLKTI